jgi:hypothetical protein
MTDMALIKSNELRLKPVIVNGNWQALLTLQKSANLITSRFLIDFLWLICLPRGAMNMLNLQCSSFETLKAINGLEIMKRKDKNCLSILLAAFCTPTQSFQLLPHLKYSPQFGEERNPDFAWQNRLTGVTYEWTSGIGYWQHYDVTSLSNDFNIPYTQGVMRKHLRCLNESAFELWSVYEPSATGIWLEGYMRLDRKDKNWDHSYLFKRTPYRINVNPFPSLTSEASTRVFLVKPGSATLHCTVNFPKEGCSGMLDADRWQFFEFWLAEEYLGRTEGRKVGAVVEYDGYTGRLKQVFQMHEIAEGASLKHPSESIDFSSVSSNFRFPTVSTVPSYESTPKPQFARTAVIHLVQGPSGPDHATDVEGPLMDTRHLDSSSSIFIPLDNGTYLKIPKCFDASINGSAFLEFGCQRLDGNWHRLALYGSQKEGLYHTICYDQWDG